MKKFLTLGLIPLAFTPLVVASACGSSRLSLSATESNAINFWTNREDEWHATFRDKYNFKAGDTISLDGSTAVTLDATTAQELNDARNANSWPGFIDSVITITYPHATDAEKLDIHNKFMDSIRSESKKHAKQNASGMYQK